MEFNFHLRFGNGVVDLKVFVRAALDGPTASCCALQETRR